MAPHALGFGSFERIFRLEELFKRAASLGERLVEGLRAAFQRGAERGRCSGRTCIRSSLIPAPTVEAIVARRGEEEEGEPGASRSERVLGLRFSLFVLVGRIKLRTISRESTAPPLHA